MIRPEYLQTFFIPKKPGKTLPKPDWSKPFAILTAYNPGGKRHDDAVNQLANRRLRTRLNQRRPHNSPPLVKIDAVSEDWSHEEKSFAVWGLSQAAAAQIGRQFRQDAYFWVENGTVHVHSCHTQEKQKVGTWESRLRTFGDRPTRNVYVIRLDPVGMQNKKRFWKANPGYKKGRDLLYVGTSILTPAERFEQHQEDTNANRYVRDHGVALAEEYFSGLPKLTANNYKDKEKEYAEKLRSQGHAVWQN